jgi:uncharacterized protein (TIGR00255 family)
LELHFKLPEAWRSIESALREQFQQQLGRGKLECRVGVQTLNLESHIEPPTLEQLQALKEAQTQVLSVFSQATQLSVADILATHFANPAESVDTDQKNTQQQAQVVQVVEQALGALKSARQREGEVLGLAVLTILDSLADLSEILGREMPAAIAKAQEKLQARLGDALSKVDGGASVSIDEILARVRQEVAALGIRADVQEELTRLNTHLVEVRRTLEQKGPHGKRLDFLLQELNREANTLGSKSVNIQMSNAAIELKQRIEQIREQIQNIE